MESLYSEQLSECCCSDLTFFNAKLVSKTFESHVNVFSLDSYATEPRFLILFELLRISIQMYVKTVAEPVVMCTEAWAA